MSGSEQELKKQRQQEILRNMANEAEVYQQNVSNIVNPAIEDLDQLDRSQELREQVKDMLLTDVRAAGALEEVYPDLVEEARKKEAKLQAQAYWEEVNKKANILLTSQKELQHLINNKVRYDDSRHT